jgi:putative FmdB family regulatory protein
MPTYELRCNECGDRFETFLMRLLKTEDKVCPSCGSTDVTTGVGGGFLGKGTSTSNPGSSGIAST